MPNYLEIAENIVREAGGIAHRAFRGEKQVSYKPDQSPVTNADVEVENFIIDALSREFPEHGFYCEESGQRRDDAEFVWVLDPIDGTNYFYREVPLFGVSLALRRGGSFEAGIVYVVETGEMFTASAAENGARLNGRPIRGSQVESLSNAIVCVEVPNLHHNPHLLEQAGERLVRLLGRCQRVRSLGASALGLAYTASGGYDAYINLNGMAHLWDVAAGRLLIEQAGGAYVTYPHNLIVAGPESLQQEVADLLK